MDKKCNCINRYPDGLCKFKFVRENRVWCLDLNSANRSHFRCLEERKQMTLVDKRWRLTRVKDRY